MRLDWRVVVASALKALPTARSDDDDARDAGSWPSGLILDTTAERYAQVGCGLAQGFLKVLRDGEGG